LNSGKSLEKKSREIKDFLSALLFYVEKGYPYPVSFKRAKDIKKLKYNDYEKAYEIGRALVLSYFSLEGRSRRKKVEEFLSRKELSIVLPDWMNRSLEKRIPLEKYKKSLLKRNVWFRVNRSKTQNEEKIIRSLELSDIEAEQDKEFTFLFKVRKGDLTRTKLFQEHLIIIQDKASVAVVEALEPSPGDRIVELASAPGLKAELMYELTEGKVELFLAEVDIQRMEKERKLLKELGVKEEKTHFVSQDSTFNTLSRGNKVLLDAPCSSSGTISSDPSVLLSLRDYTRVGEYARLQSKMLNSLMESNFEYAVFSTCSIFPEEGEVLLEPYNDLIVKTRLHGSRGYTDFQVGDKITRYFSWIHDSQDFVIAGLRGDLKR
jgi:16S rRNA (cytosine967-C5)-methyltransferase